MFRNNNRPIVCQYCGPKTVLPPGYDVWGTAYSCLRAGIGVGKYGEKRTWQRRLGLPVDAEYVSQCGENAYYNPRRIRRARSRSRSRSQRRSRAMRRSRRRINY